MAALLPLASQGDEAASSSALSVARAVQEEGLGALVAELLKGLEDPCRRLGTAQLLPAFCKGTRLDLEVRAGGLWLWMP